ncbi:microsomal signal peptidase 12 kDa subunit-domain-containing protein [Aspergillus egyptiacus]|nr:microsomal signal peptidase 12 kDa subunit-domain-containing protein [Aspergillus egyptiacus]
MDDILAPLQNAFEGQIVSFGRTSHLLSSHANLAFSAEQDFHGQRVTEVLSTALLIISGVVAFFVGYIFQDIYLTLWTGLAGTLLTALVVIPPWPFYNKHPEKWLVPLPHGAGGASIVVDGVKVA